MCVWQGPVPGKPSVGPHDRTGFVSDASSKAACLCLLVLRLGSGRCGVFGELSLPREEGNSALQSLPPFRLCPSYIQNSQPNLNNLTAVGCSLALLLVKNEVITVPQSTEKAVTSHELRIRRKRILWNQGSERPL